MLLEATSSPLYAIPAAGYRQGTEPHAGPSWADTARSCPTGNRLTKSETSAKPMHPPVRGASCRRELPSTVVLCVFWAGVAIPCESVLEFQAAGRTLRGSFSA